MGRLIAGAGEDVRLRPVADLAAAVALLTRVPVRGGRERVGAWAFGLVGGGLGVAAATPLLLLPAGIGSPAQALLAIAVLAVASGALHLDGLADTADALAAPSADAAERARRDPRTGAAGAVALILVLGLDASLLATLLDRRGSFVAAAVLVGAAAASRAAAAVAPSLAGPAWRDGFGRWFAERTSWAASVVALASAGVVAAVVAVGSGSAAPGAAVVGALLAGSVAAVVLRRLRRGLDGDALGAVVELAFAGALLAAAASP